MVRATWQFLLIITTAQIGMEVWTRATAWKSSLQHSETAMENVVRAAADHAESTLSEVESLLDGVVERVETDGLQGNERVRLQRYLAFRVRKSEALQGVFVFDQTGRWRVTSHEKADPTENNSDRSYFVHHRNHNSRKVYIGKPVVSRSTGQWVLPISRRINDAGGSFAGVALATIPVRHFKDYYARFSLGHRSTMLLANVDGTLVMEHPLIEGAIGGTIRDTPVFHFMQAQGPSATGMIVTIPGNRERLYSYRHLSRYPLVLGLAMERSEIFSDWGMITLQECAVLLIMILGGFWIGYRLVLQIQLRVRLEESLRDAHTALEARNAALDKLARTDPLTGLYNRRNLDEHLNLETARAARNRGVVALIMIDVDFFKRYNDRYGHAAGDDCLRMVAACIKENIGRSGDLAARFGGEEFAILLPETPLGGARVVAEQICQSIQTRRHPHEESEFGIVTISAGVAALIPDGEGAVRRLVESADENLYLAKAAGRNCVR